MFATRKFRDEVGILDPGLIRASFSASTQVSSGAIQDMAKFRKLVYELYAEGVQYGNKTLSLYSCSVSFSSISSASSNWAVVDSVNAAVTMYSSAASGSASRYAVVLETRAEKAPRYIRPVITCTSGVSSSSVDNAYLIAKGLLPQYGTAASQEPVAVVLTEVDYL